MNNRPVSAKCYRLYIDEWWDDSWTKCYTLLNGIAEQWATSGYPGTLTDFLYAGMYTGAERPPTFEEFCSPKNGYLEWALATLDDGEIDAWCVENDLDPHTAKAFKEQNMSWEIIWF